MKMRFCTSCQSHREEITGVLKQLNKTRRWICRLCLDKKTESIYRSTSGRNDDAARITGSVK